MRTIVIFVLLIYACSYLAAQVSISTEPTCSNINIGKINIDIDPNHTDYDPNWSPPFDLYWESLNNSDFGQDEIDLNYTINNLYAGDYLVEIYFDGLCEVSTIINVPEKGATIQFNPLIRPIDWSKHVGAIFLNDFNATDDNGNSITATFEWKDPNGDVISNSKDLNSIIQPGDYCITINTPFCQNYTKCFYIDLCGDLIDATVNAGEVSCDMDLIDITLPLKYSPNQKPPYEVAWSDGGKGAFRYDLTHGNYNVTVSDQYNCESESLVTIDLLNPPISGNLNILNEFVGCEDGSVEFVTSSSNNYTYYWSSHETTRKASKLNGGINFLTVTDNNGCSRVYNSILQDLDHHIKFLGSEMIDDCIGNNEGSISFSNSSGERIAFTLIRLDKSVPIVLEYSNSSQFIIDGLENGRYFYEVHATDESGVKRNNCRVKSGYLEICCCLNNSLPPSSYICSNQSNDYAPLSTNPIITPAVSGNNGSIVFNPSGGPGNGNYVGQMLDDNNNVIKEGLEYNYLFPGSYKFKISDGCIVKIVRLIVPGCQYDGDYEIFFDTFIKDYSNGCFGDGAFITFIIPGDPEVFEVSINGNIINIADEYPWEETFTHNFNGSLPQGSNKVNLIINYEGCIYEEFVTLKNNPLEYIFSKYSPSTNKCIYIRKCNGKTIDEFEEIPIELPSIYHKCGRDIFCEKKSLTEPVYTKKGSYKWMKAGLYAWLLGEITSNTHTFFEAARDHLPAWDLEACDKVRICLETFEIVDVNKSDVLEGTIKSIGYDKNGCYAIDCTGLWWTDGKICADDPLYPIDYPEVNNCTVFSVSLLDIDRWIEKGIISELLPGILESRNDDFYTSIQSLIQVNSDILACARASICVSPDNEYTLLNDNIDDIKDKCGQELLFPDSDGGFISVPTCVPLGENYPESYSVWCPCTSFEFDCYKGFKAYNYNVEYVKEKEVVKQKRINKFNKFEILTNNDTSDIVIFPNPCISYINIKSNNSAIHKIEIYTLQGEKIYVRQNMIDEYLTKIRFEPNILPGIYIINVVTENKVKKIILNKT